MDCKVWMRCNPCVVLEAYCAKMLIAGNELLGRRAQRAPLDGQLIAEAALESLLALRLRFRRVPAILQELHGKANPVYCLVAMPSELVDAFATALLERLCNWLRS